MKKFVLFFTVITLVINQSFSQGRWEWARKAGDVGYDGSGPLPLVSDGNGIYLAGAFDDPSPSGDVTFGSLSASGIASTSDYSNAFIAAYNSDASSCSWVKTFSGITGLSPAQGIVWVTCMAQTTNDLFIGAYFQGHVNFGGTLGSQYSGYGKGLIIKMSKSSGAISTSTIADSDSSMEILGIDCSDDESKVVITGRRRPNYWQSYTDFFVSSYNTSSLSLNWSATSPSSSGYAAGSYIVMNGNYVFVYGSVNGSLTFKNASGTNSSYSITSATDDAFIVRYHITSGPVGALRQIGLSANAESPAGIAVNASNDIYVAGNYAGTASTLTYLDATHSVAAAGYSDIYWATYDQSLTYNNCGKLASAGHESATAIAVNSANFSGAGFYIVGYAQSSTATFCSSNQISTNAGFIEAKYLFNGTPAWIEQTPNASAGWISENPSTHKMDVSGTFSGTAIFNSTVLTSYGSSDIFIGSCTKPACAGLDVAFCTPTQIGCDPVSGATYSWSPSTYLSSPTVAQPTVSAPGLSYTLTMTVNGCVSVDAVTTSSCRIGNELKQNELPLYTYPNPTSNNFTVTLNNDEHLQSARLIDYSGRIVFSEREADNNNTIAFNLTEKDIGKGIYFVEVTTDLGKYKSKVVIQ